MACQVRIFFNATQSPPPCQKPSYLWNRRAGLQWFEWEMLPIGSCIWIPIWSWSYCAFKKIQSCCRKEATGSRLWELIVSPLSFITTRLPYPHPHAKPHTPLSYFWTWDHPASIPCSPHHDDGQPFETVSKNKLYKFWYFIRATEKWQIQWRVG